MKKEILSILIFYFGISQICYSQIIKDPITTFCYCKAINSKVDHVIERYLTRSGLSNANAKGVIAIKFPSMLYDTSEFTFYLTELLKVSVLKQNKPAAFTYIKGFPILIYGNTKILSCENRNYGNFYNLITKKYLLDDLRLKNSNKLLDLQSAIFDPEILEVTIHQSSISSQKELSAQPDLKN